MEPEEVRLIPAFKEMAYESQFYSSQSEFAHEERVSLASITQNERISLADPAPPSREEQPGVAPLETIGSTPVFPDVLLRLNAEHNLSELPSPLNLWLTRPETLQRWQRAMEQVTRCRMPVRLEFVHTGQNRNQIFQTIFTFDPTEEQPSQILTVTRDITSLIVPRPLETEVPGRKTDVNEKSETVASLLLIDLSHELRSPLNGILASGESLLRSELTSVQQRRVALIQQSARSLLMIAENVLDIAQMDEGKIQLAESPLSLSALAEEVIEVLRSAATEKGLRLRLALEAGLPTDTHGDAGRIRQILINLTDNAIKYTEVGEVVLRVELTRLSDVRATITFSVEDTGIGIAPSRLASMFERFERNSDLRGLRGVGLGLAISRELAQRMRGNLMVSSVPGHGSDFRLVLPLKRIPPPLLPSSSVPPSVKDGESPVAVRLTITESVDNTDDVLPLAVVLDDDPVSREVLGELLARVGYRPLVAADLEELGTKLGEAIPEVFFVDYRLETETAPEIMRRLRESNALLEKVPVVIVSAHRESEIEALTTSEEFFAVLEKPVSGARLRKIQEALNISPTSADTLSVLDSEALLEKVAGNRSVLARLARIFLQEYPPVFGAIEKAVSTGDLSTLVRKAHQLRGMTMAVNAEASTYKIKILEDNAQTQAPEILSLRVAEVRTELERLEMRLRALAP